MTFETKDSGAREEYASGMVRDVQDDKPRWDLIIPDGIPYADQFLTRFAELLARGANKYGDRNWEKGDSTVELERARASAFRHFMQWFTGEVDEDHSVACLFNIQQVEVLKYKLSHATDVTLETKVGYAGHTSGPGCRACKRAGLESA